MARRAVGFMGLPGGFGTFEEVCLPCPVQFRAADVTKFSL